MIEKTAGTRKNEFWNCEKTNNTIDDVSKNEATIQCDNILSEIGEYEKGSSSQKCSYFKFKKHRLAFWSYYYAFKSIFAYLAIILYK